MFLVLTDLCDEVLKHIAVSGRLFAMCVTFEVMAKRQGLLDIRKRPFLIFLTCNFA